MSRNRRPLSLPTIRSRNRYQRLWFRFTLALIAFALFAELFASRLVILNTSASVPCGLYVASLEEPAVGRLVDFPVPQTAWEYLRSRTDDDVSGWYILKPIAAGPGDHIDTTGGRLLINGIDCGPITTLDSAGNSLPLWRACRRLRGDEFFVYSDLVPIGFDSRHFGPIRLIEIDSARTPLMTW